MAFDIDRRNFGRRATSKIAVMVHDCGLELPCLVANFSDTGALLKTQHTDLAGEEFTLEIRDDDMSVRCGIAWRDANSIGVKFLKPPRRMSWKKR